MIQTRKQEEAEDELPNEDIAARPDANAVPRRDRKPRRVDDAPATADGQRSSKRIRREANGSEPSERGAAAGEREGATSAPLAAPADLLPENAEESEPRVLREGDLVVVTNEW